MADGPEVTAIEALARSIDPSGFGQAPAYEAWAASRRQSAYDRARKYLAALTAAGFTVAAAQA